MAKLDWIIKLTANGVRCQDCGKVDNYYPEYICNAKTYGMNKYGHPEFQVVIKMCREEMIENIESMTIGLDDTFQFHCTQCGKCCTYRDDIILSPMDIFRMSKELNMSPAQFYNRYCVFNIGEHSRVTIVRLGSVGKDGHCPLLKNHKCSVHKVKPAVCGMFPLGRYIAIESGKYNKDSIAASEVKYLLQPLDCGDDSETHTVREWLSGFNIKLEDEAFFRWHQVIAQLGDKIRLLEKTEDMITMMEVWLVVRVALYLQYNTNMPFLPQFESNTEGLFDLLKNLPRLKRMVQNAGRA